MRGTGALLVSPERDHFCGMSPGTRVHLCDMQIREDIDGEPLTRGTRVTLHLKEDAAEYASDKKLGSLIKQYSEFIAFPIKLWAKKCAL